MRGVSTRVETRSQRDDRLGESTLHAPFITHTSQHLGVLIEQRATTATTATNHADPMNLGWGGVI